MIQQYNLQEKLGAGHQGCKWLRKGARQSFQTRPTSIAGGAYCNFSCTKAHPLFVMLPITYYPHSAFFLGFHDISSAMICLYALGKTNTIWIMCLVLVRAHHHLRQSSSLHLGCIVLCTNIRVWYILRHIMYQWQTLLIIHTHCEGKKLLTLKLVEVINV